MSHHTASMNTLIAYATTEGHTRTIATNIADWLRSQKHDVDLLDTACVPSDFDPKKYGAFILLGSVHMGKHQGSLTHFAKKNLAALQSKPSAFLSVSMSAAAELKGTNLADPDDYVKSFEQETGWIPGSCLTVAGALKYVEYDWLKRMVVKLISKKEHMDTDTSQDFVYTDWPALQDFVLKFASRTLQETGARA